MATTRLKTTGTIALALLSSLLVLPAHSHHSFAIYDSDDPQTIDGVVEEFRWVNPHSMVRLRVANEYGSESTWQLDFDPVNMLARRGWTPDSLKPGDAIIAEVHPLHSGQAGGRLIEIEHQSSEDPLPERSGSPTILNVPPPDPVAMSDAEARNLNGIWFNANGGLHFDSTVARAEQDPPLRPQYMEQWQQRRLDAAAGIATTDPTAECLPAGFPRFLSMVFPGEILQADHQINWYAEWGQENVRIYLDGRTPPEGLLPSYTGFTTGHWEDNTLVAETIAIREGTLVDTTGVPHSDQLTSTMRIRKITPDYFEVAVTLEDPIVFYEPWSTVKHFVRGPAGEYARENSCFEGNRYRIADDGTLEVIIE